MNKPNIIVIAGPTASGKTSLGVAVAKKINGEIISADSMQIYKYMNIGTAKPTEKEKQGVYHHLMDFLEPDQAFSVAKYKLMAEEKIQEILNKGKMPIIVGGTGLYINSLVNGIKFQETEIDYEYRDYLRQRAEKEGLKVLHEELKIIDPDSAERISENDFKRISRALEVYKTTGKTITYHNYISKEDGVLYNYIMFGISFPRQELYDKINNRVDVMIKNGLIQEVKLLLHKYKEFPTAMQGLGYKEVKDYLDGNSSKEEMIETLKMQTRRYAKRQLTWFRRDERIHWLNGEDGVENNVSKILQIIKITTNAQSY